MNGTIIYFSGTGNTEYVAELYKKEFEKKGHNIHLIDIIRDSKLNDDYDFLILGSPIHCEVFPYFFMNWVNKNISDGKGRKCIIFSTQAADKAAGADILAKELIKKNIKVVVKDFIVMPNNYYVTAFKENSRFEIDSLKKEAEKKVKKHVNIFLDNKIYIKNVSRIRCGFGKFIYNGFNKFTKDWAKKRFSVDYNLCIYCGRCANNCPTNNIIINRNNKEIKFKNACISCQKCLHLCPKNAFLYKGKHFKQYKL